MVENSEIVSSCCLLYFMHIVVIEIEKVVAVVVEIAV
jgi:hypothetical protein